MKRFLFNQKPIKPLELDPDFTPIVLGNLAFVSAVKETENPQEVRIAIRRTDSEISTISTVIFDQENDQDDANFIYIERLIKTLLWLKGGYKIIFGGPKEVGDKIVKAYQSSGLRSFDADFMSRIYQKDFEVEVVPIEEVPVAHEVSKPIGRHLDGYRIGFDAGGSDRKVSAVVNGESIYSEEIVWHPKTNSDPMYHYNGILDSLKRAANKMPRVDAIGISSAGVFINNEVAAASLFREVPEGLFNQVVRTMYIDVCKEIGDVPIEVANDGDVTALSGAMSLDSNRVLGIAMGTSQAVGYVDNQGYITGWLNELAFVPVDYNQNSMLDEWSGDYGCGVTYFSQDAVIKLANKAGLHLEKSLSPADKLKVVQELHNEGNTTAELIFDTIGAYLGYSIAYYATFYDIEHLLILGRVTSGKGGERVIKKAKEILYNEFRNIHEKINLTLPDEKSRRVGQSIAAASLPKL